MTSKELEVELRRLFGRYKDAGDLLGALTIREQLGRLTLSHMSVVLAALHTLNSPLSEAQSEECPF